MLRFTKQLQCPSVTAFSLTSLFLERIWRKYKISLRSQKPVSKTKPSKNGILFLYHICPELWAPGTNNWMKITP